MWWGWEWIVGVVAVGVLVWVGVALWEYEGERSERNRRDKKW